MARLNLQDTVPYAYCPGSSPLHRLPAAFKLLFLLFLSLAAFFFGPPVLPGEVLLLFLGARSAGIRSGELLRGAGRLWVMVLAVLAFRSFRLFPPAFYPPGFLAGARFAGTVLVSFTAASLLFKVTTMTEFRESLGKVEGLLCRPLIWLLKPLDRDWARGLRRRLERPRLSLAVALLLGFLPQFFELWGTASKAYAARAGKNGLPRLIALIPLVTEGMMERAAETARALEARGLTL